MDKTNYFCDHSKLHDAIKVGDIDKVIQLIYTSKLIPCYIFSSENCYLLAQKHSQREILKLLLKYDSQGIKALYPDSDTLLIKDIKQYQCQNFDILSKTPGLDVNKANKDGFTALHYATLINTTPIGVIFKLISLKAQVNKRIDNINCLTHLDRYKFGLISATPMICLLKNFDINNSGFEKLKLLLDNGVLINHGTTDGRTPLMYATNIQPTSSLNLEVIKYLFKKGAYAGLLTNDNQNALTTLTETLIHINLSDEDTEKLINEYYIPVTNLLIEKGDDPFIGTNNSNMLINNIAKAFASKKNVNSYLLYFLQKQFQVLLDQGKTSRDLCKYQKFYPLESVLHCLVYFVSDRQLLLEIIKLIVDFPGTDFKTFTPDLTKKQIQVPEKLILSAIGLHYYYIEKNNCNATSNAIKYMPLDILEETLEMMRKNNFCFNRDALILFLLRVLAEPTSDERIILKLIDFFIRHETKIFTDNFHEHVLDRSKSLTMIKFHFHVPDCIWIAAIIGNSSIFRKLWQFYEIHPVNVLVVLFTFLDIPSEEASTLNSIEKIFPTLMELTGERPLKEGMLLELLRGDIKRMSQRAQRLNREEDLPLKAAYDRVIRLFLQYPHTFGSIVPPT